MPRLILNNLAVEGAGEERAFALLNRRAGDLERERMRLREFCSGREHFLGHVPPDRERLEEIARAAGSLASEAQTLVVAGIGGSSLGGKVLCTQDSNRKVVFWEGNDTDAAGRMLSFVPWDKAAVNIVSKSGETLETLVNGGLCIEALKAQHGDAWRKRVIVSASPGGGRLQRWASSEGVAVIEIPEQVGGRYSALTVAGLLPASFSGTDIAKVAEGAKRGAEMSLHREGENNPAILMACQLVGSMQCGLSEVDLWGYGDVGYTLAFWLQQLWAESLGRRVGPGPREERVGPTPLACRGSEDQHSLLQLFVDGPTNRWVLLITTDGKGPALSSDVRGFAGLPDRVKNVGTVQEALWMGTERLLSKTGIPVCRYHIGEPTPDALGEALLVLQVSTLYAAALLDVDPFGQPGVEAGKRFTRAILAGDM